MKGELVMSCWTKPVKVDFAAFVGRDNAEDVARKASEFVGDKSAYLSDDLVGHWVVIHGGRVEVLLDTEFKARYDLKVEHVGAPVEADVKMDVNIDCGCCSTSGDQCGDEDGLSIFNEADEDDYAGSDEDDEDVYVPPDDYDGDDAEEGENFEDAEDCFGDEGETFESEDEGFEYICSALDSLESGIEELQMEVQRLAQEREMHECAKKSDRNRFGPEHLGSWHGPWIGPMYGPGPITWPMSFGSPGVGMGVPFGDTPKHWDRLMDKGRRKPRKDK